MISKAKLSIIIITKNEERNIKRCLESVKWAHEIIIVDAFSDDQTIEICKEYTDKIYKHEWEGYGKQKAFALSKATNEWVLSIDADEEISLQLKHEISEAIKSMSTVGYTIPIILSFYGQIIKYANGSGKNLRLFQKSKGYIEEREVHEKIVIKGVVKKLKKPIIHYSFSSIDSLLTKLNYYSTLNANLNIKKGNKSSITKAIIHGLWLFFRIYILNLGFLDGRAGFVLAVAFGQTSYYRYIKQYYLTRNYK